ncbi:katanin p60 ATPase-containing subunit A-like 2 isoform X2 [Diachasmimorpha longicaudata]
MREAQLTPEVQVCDNIDLESILMDYSDYHLSRFNKLPKICKKIENPGVLKEIMSLPNIPSKKEKIKPRKSDPEDSPDERKSFNIPEAEDNFGMTIIPISSESVNKSRPNDRISSDRKLLRSLDELFPRGSEYRDIADVIMREVVLMELNVRWSDIVGLEDCKQVLEEAIIYPIRYPDIFSEKFTPWNGVMLYGPPGTGKTMLARAVATECNCTFFNVTASTLISKWRGDSEKYVRVLCDLARHQAPSIIFIDEIDWIISGDNDAGTSSEPARRFRAELLARLDGLVTLQGSRVLLLATTNAPWNLDAALLRRLEKHLLINHPTVSARRQMLKYYTSPTLHKQNDFEQLIKETEFYSGSDLKQMCKEAWMIQMRQYISTERDKDMNKVKGPDQINSIDVLKAARKTILPTTKHLTDRYKQWESRVK